MTKSLAFLLIAFLCLSTLVLSISADEKQNICDKRPNYDDCYDVPFALTCAYYKENCPFDACGINHANWCYACLDSKTVYYVNSTCKESEIVFVCSDDHRVCNKFLDPQIKKAYEPVCGSLDGGKEMKTFDNKCASCAKGYDWYQSGPCQKDRHKCKASDRGKNCTSAKYNQICAHLTAEDNTTAFTTAWSGCAACADKAVDYYTEGECGPLRDNVTYCLPNTRAEFCTLEHNPVCAFYLDENNTLQHKIKDSPSCACAEEGIIYHIPEPCVFTCDRRPDINKECDHVLVEPICGTHEESGVKANVSLQNNCEGCYYVPLQINSYVDGLCPGDEGVYCENYGGFNAEGIISPVCGVTKEGCDDDSCKTSFTEPAVACADSSTLLFKKGLCPGDEGFSCSPFRKGVIIDKHFYKLELLNYGEVCGYAEVGCEENSCRDTYTNQTVACSDESVIFFTPGACL